MHRGIVDRARIGSWRAAPNEETSDSSSDYIGEKKRSSNCLPSVGDIHGRTTGQHGCCAEDEVSAVPGNT
jgi:hypothetical protein